MSALTDLRGRLSDIDSYVNTATILAVSLVATLALVWMMYESRGLVNWAEKSSLFNTLFICDAIAFTVGISAVLSVLYLSSLFYGEGDGQLKPEALAAFFIVMTAPLAFIGGEMVFRPSLLEDHGIYVAAGLSAASMATGVLFLGFTVLQLTPRKRIKHLIRRIVDEYQAAGEATSTSVRPFARLAPTGPSLGLLGLLKKLSASGDVEPVRYAIDSCASNVADAEKRAADDKALAMAGALVGHIVEAGAIGADARNIAVVAHAVDRLRDIAIQSRVESIASMAFRGIGHTYVACVKQDGWMKGAVVEPWMAGVYAAIYDGTRRREPLEKARMAVERALSDKEALAPEERARVLHVSGRVYRRLAEADASEEKAMLAASLLEEARTTGAAGPLDHAFEDMEIGRAYMTLAPLKNPIKSYRKALASFEEAGRVLTPTTARWDAALLEAYSGDASTMLADEYRRAHRYEDALDSARAAIERYTAAARFITAHRSPGDHGRIMSNAGLAHTVISEIYAHGHELDSALKHASAAIECYTSALAATDKGLMPESYASLKVSMGIAYVGIAEIYFKEKRYEEALSSCDSAIAAYNEALRTYEGSGKEKLATPARKHLKQANDLFNTFMMIGSGRVPGKEGRGIGAVARASGVNEAA